MRLFCLFIALLLVAARPAAQNPEEIENSTVLVEDLLRRAERSDNPAGKAQLAEQALAIARSLRFDGGIVRAAMMLGDYQLSAGRTEEAMQYYLEAENKAQSSRNFAALANAYTALGDLFFREKLYETALLYYDKALKIDPYNFGVMEKKADAGLEDMRFDSAEYYYKELVIKYKRDADYGRLVQVYQKLANAYNANNDPSRGLFYYLAIADIVDHHGTVEQKAILYNNLGRQYTTLHDFPRALEYFQKAELQCKFIECEQPEVLYANIGVVLHNMGRDDEAQAYLMRAHDILSARNDRYELASLERLIADFYFNANDYYNALHHSEKALQFARVTQQRDVLAGVYRMEADIYHALYDFEKAYDYYQRYLVMLDSIRFDEQLRRQHIDQQRSLLTSAEGQIRYLITRQDMKELELQNEKIQREKLELENRQLLQEKEKAEAIALKQREVDEARKRELALQALQARDAARLATQQLSVEKQDRLIADLRRQEEIDRAQQQVDSARRAQEIELLRRDKALSDLEIRQQASFRRFAYGLGLLGLIILALLGAGWWLSRRTGRRLASQNKRIEAQKAVIEAERHKSDALLRNILPEEIASELRSRGHADPRYYESATVLFTDFLNFTRLTTHLTPEQLIDELDECFLAFDEICEKYQLEKIKTIGDAYMCAAGLPVPVETHAVDAVLAAQEMMQWLEARKTRKPEAVLREMRIGIHSGAVIAGVIGKNKFAYDIWGDAVNLAARMEELGEPGRINISGATYDAVKHRFVCSYRGKKEVHNKGPVDMYFVDREI